MTSRKQVYTLVGYSLTVLSPLWQRLCIRGGLPPTCVLKPSPDYNRYLPRSCVVIKNAPMGRLQFANGVGLSVLAAELIFGLAVVSHWTASTSASPVWYALPLEFLVFYSVLSLSAMYLWGNPRTLRKPTHWLAFMAVSSVLLTIGPNYIRLAGAAGIILGVASVARSLVLNQ